MGNHRVRKLLSLSIVAGKVVKNYAELIFDSEGYELYKLTGGSVVGYSQLSCTKGQYVRQYFHRVLMQAPDDKVVDHINGNSLDNRKCNLRLCDRHQNQANLQKQANKKSNLPKGVFYDKRYNKYYAKTVHKYKQQFLGYFLTPEAAEEVYREAVVRLKGEYALHASRPEST